MTRGQAWVWMLLVLGVLILLVVFRARVSFRDNACAMNIENVAMAMNMYATDWDGRFPDPDHWLDAVLSAEVGYIKNTAVLKCPLDKSDARCSYGMNRALADICREDITNQDDLVLHYETAHPGDNPSGGPEDVVYPPRHPRCNDPLRCYKGDMYGYASGKLTPGEVWKLPHLTVWEPELKRGQSGTPSPSAGPRPPAAER